ncbi:MAG: aldehyde dehydrogenase family protein [Rhodospirillales bacterium]|nr:aldehyde dehydrogenase family protein [Rhodospirillales bacterium]
MTAPRIDIDGVSVSPDHYIAGRRVPSERCFEDRSPLDWTRKLGDFAAGDAETAEQAVGAAADAFPGWSARSPAERGAYMHRLAELIDANVGTLARLECLDMAMLQESLELRVIPRGARN